MSRARTIRRAATVLAAAAVVLLLAGSLVFRVAAGGRPGAHLPAAAADTVPRMMEPPAPARVAEPRAFGLDDLSAPRCWGCSWNTYHASEFQVDLDFLAPLGDGAGNAALWLRDFARSDGARRDEAYKDRLVERTIRGKTWRVLPGDDPLLLEAEPWVDRARCRFYPDVWQVVGADTAVPNLLLALNLARSWVARGYENQDPALARDDFRRAIRLGRLLRQDDVTLIQDLVAIACIRLGGEALYEQARQEGDAVTMVATALVLADKDAMRFLAARRITISDNILRGLERGWLGGWSLEVGDGQVDDLVGLARKAPERRYRMEAVIAMRLVQHLGTTEQREAVREVLDEFAAADDELLAGLARLARDDLPGDSELEMLHAEAMK